MTLLTTKKQLLAATEAVGGTQATLTTSDGAEALDAQGAIEVETFDREVASDSISRKKGIQGQKVGTLGFGLELAGTALGTFAAGEPEIARFLKACGFRGQAVSKLTLTASGGNTVTNATKVKAFRHLETVEGGTSGATATVFQDTHNGDTALYVWNVTGTFSSGETITGSASGSTAALASAITANVGYGYWPISQAVINLKIDGGGSAVAAGTVIQGATSGARAQLLEEVAATTADQTVKVRPIRGVFTQGEDLDDLSTPATGVATIDNNAGYQTFAYGGTLSTRLNEDGVAKELVGARGNVKWDMSLSRPVRVNFDFRGSAIQPYDLLTTAGLTFNKNPSPPLWVGTVASIANAEDDANSSVSDEITPCITSMGVDIGNQLTDRNCAANATGLEEVVISKRQGTMSFDPEATLEADIPWLAHLYNGKTVRLRNTIGTANGNKFVLSMPGIQYEQVPSGDRNGALTREVTGKVTSGAGTALSAAGGDNELTLLYLTNG